MPSAPTTTLAPRVAPSLEPVTPIRARSRSRRRPSAVAPPRTDAPAAAASSSRCGIERRPVEADRRVLERPGPAVGQPKAGAAAGLDAHRGHGRATRPRSSSAMPTDRSAATAAGEANTPHARQRHARRSLEEDDLVACARQQHRGEGPAGPPPTTPTSTDPWSSMRHGGRGGTAAIAQRCRREPAHLAMGWRPAATSRSRSSDRRVCPADRQRPIVERERVPGQRVEDQPRAEPVQPARARGRSPRRRCGRPGQLAEEAPRVDRVQVMEHQRGVGDVERVVREGERPAVGDEELDIGPDGETRVDRAGPPRAPRAGCRPRSRGRHCHGPGARIIAIGMSARARCRRRGRAAGSAPARKRPSPAARAPASPGSESPAPPNRRLIRAQVGRLPASAVGSVSGPSRCSSSPASRRIRQSWRLGTVRAEEHRGTRAPGVSSRGRWPPRRGSAPSHPPRRCCSPRCSPRAEPSTVRHRRAPAPTPDHPADRWRPARRGPAPPHAHRPARAALVLRSGTSTRSRRAPSRSERSSASPRCRPRARSSAPSRRTSTST